jgi:hypothetical protein
MMSALYFIEKSLDILGPSGACSCKLSKSKKDASESLHDILSSHSVP